MISIPEENKLCAADCLSLMSQWNDNCVDHYIFFPIRIGQICSGCKPYLRKFTPERGLAVG